MSRCTSARRLFSTLRPRDPKATDRLDPQRRGLVKSAHDVQTRRVSNAHDEGKADDDPKSVERDGRNVSSCVDQAAESLECAKDVYRHSRVAHDQSGSRHHKRANGDKALMVFENVEEVQEVTPNHRARQPAATGRRPLGHEIDATIVESARAVNIVA